MTDLADHLARIESICRQGIQVYDSDLHGLPHLREVALLAGEIASETGTDVESAMVAGFLHDCGRVNDGGGDQHAIDSAELARPLLRKHYPHLDACRICDAIARHADGLVTDDPLAGALWDADRLTLMRLGSRVSEQLMSTEAGRQRVRVRNHSLRSRGV